MYKNLVRVAATVGLILGGGILIALDASAVKMEEGVKIIPNELDDIMVTRIAPSLHEVDLIFNKINPAYENEDRMPFRLNVGYGNFSDMDIYSIDDYKSVSDQGFPEEIGATRIVSAMANSLIPWGWASGETLYLYGPTRINLNADLIDGSGGRLIYKVMFIGGERLLGRVDYTRCIHSSVFLSGEATECRMEYLDNNKVQYQPYTKDGTRVEIPAEEDAILTAATEAWEAPYGWPDLPPEPEPEPEPIVEPEPEPVEPEPVEPEPEPIVEPEPEPIVEPEPEPVEPEPAKPMDLWSNSPTTELEPVVMDSDPEVVLTGVKTDGTEAIKIESNEATEKEIKMTEVTDEASTGTGAGGFSAITDETGGVNNTIVEGVKIVKSDDSLDYNEVETTDVAENTIKEITKTWEDKQSEVEVPELGQETGKKPNIAVSIAIIAGVGAALVAAWWFLFLGKHKSKEEKEGKE